jgi:hypothetical protein
MSKKVLHKRFFHELTEEERKTLTDIKAPNDIKTTECLAEWANDHVVCFGAKINGVELGFWWVGSNFGEYLGCAGGKPDGNSESDESAEARKKVFDALVNEIRNSKTPKEQMVKVMFYDDEPLFIMVKKPCFDANEIGMWISPDEGLAEVKKMPLSEAIKLLT